MQGGWSKVPAVNFWIIALLVRSALRHHLHCTSIAEELEEQEQLHREEEGHQPSSIRPRFLAENRGLQGVVQGCSMRQPWEQVWQSFLFDDQFATRRPQRFLLWPQTSMYATPTLVIGRKGCYPTMGRLSTSIAKKRIQSQGSWVLDEGCEPNGPQ
ncbi:hypothetical protein B0O80DRAFT_424291 [Mortierella sp. GBAus27b]|nr:hypothetical protein B0O80DRAFT_424291 [Mortierella sp. GBAus27b]